MKTLMMIVTIAFGLAAPATADSPAEDAAQHDFTTSFVTERTLGKTSPAEVYDSNRADNGDVIATQNMEALRLLSADGPAEIAARKLSPDSPAEIAARR